MPNLLSPTQVVLTLTILGLFTSILVAWIWIVIRVFTGRALLDNRLPVVVPWEGWAVLGVLAAWMILGLVVPIFYLMASGKVKLNGEAEMFGPGDLIAVTSIVSGVFLILAPVILKQFGGARWSHFGLTAHDPEGTGMNILRGIVAWPMVAPLIFGVNYLAIKIWPMGDTHPLQQWITSSPGGSAVWMVSLFAGAVIAPITEEFLFRGVLLGWLNRRAMGIRKALVTPLMEASDPVDPSIANLENRDEEITWIESATPTSAASTIEPTAGLTLRLWVANIGVSLLFAAMHGSVWPSPVPLFVLSMVLGFLYQRTGGIVAPIALHATFNGISTVILFLVTAAAPEADLKVPVPQKPTPPTPVTSLFRHEMCGSEEYRLFSRISMDGSWKD